MEHRRGGRPRHPDVLTPAEWRVLEELRRGGTNAEIASRLGIGSETVKSHISSMLAKLDLQRREELAAWRPDGRRDRLRAVFAAPAALAFVARPLLWVGLGTAAVAGVAAAVVAALVALAVVLVVVPADGDPSTVAPPPVTTPEAITMLNPTATATPSPVASPSPTPSPTPMPTATPPPTPTPDPTGPAIRYDRFDPTGEASTPGSYAFLMPAPDSEEEGATTVVTTYEQIREESSVLRVSLTDATGASQRERFRRVVAGDIIEWHQADDCFVRYTVNWVIVGAARMDLAVEWMTYAFTGCGGAMNASESVSLKLGPLPTLGGFSLTVPLVHGVFQIVPSDWTGAIRERQIRHPDHMDVVEPTGATTLVEARELPYWRDVTLPDDDWRLGLAWTDPYPGPAYGYCANFVDEEGYRVLEVCGYYAASTYNRWVAAGMLERNRGPDVQSVREARTIVGRPAIVLYSPDGPPRGEGFAYIWVYDRATESEYTLKAIDFDLANDLDAAIAITASLFEEESPPIASPAGPVLRYDRFDPTGEASTPGSYAFLMPDPDSAEEGATTVVTTYDQLSHALTVLSVNVTDADGVSQAGFYETVQAGDVIEWLPAEQERCWERYRVKEVLPDPEGEPPRKLFAVEWLHHYFHHCSGPIDGSEVAVELRWRPPAARAGADGIPTILPDQPVEGAGTYRTAPWSPLLIDLPAGLRVGRDSGLWLGGGQVTVTLYEVESGSTLTLDVDTGDEVHRSITPAGRARNVGALFDVIVGSARTTESPAW